VHKLVIVSPMLQISRLRSVHGGPLERC